MGIDQKKFVDKIGRCILPTGLDVWILAQVFVITFLFLGRTNNTHATQVLKLSDVTTFSFGWNVTH